MRGLSDKSQDKSYEREEIFINNTETQNSIFVIILTSFIMLSVFGIIAFVFIFILDNARYII